MNRLKINSPLNKYINGFWNSFKQFNAEFRNETILLDIFKFNLLYVTFYKIISENERKNSNQTTSLTDYELLDYFNRIFCSNNVNITLDESTECIFYAMKKKLDSRNKIVVPFNLLIKINEKLFEREKIADDLINEVFTISLTLNKYGKSLVKKMGIFYTPMRLAELISRNSIDKFLQTNELEELKLFDSSCGSGNFLVSSFKVLFEYYSLNSKGSAEINTNLSLIIVQKHLYGLDIDSWAVITCKLRLFLTITENTKNFDFSAINYSEVFNNFRKADFLTTKITTRPNIIVGNPPWGKIGINDYKHDLADSLSFQNGQRDVYRFFIEVSMKLDPLILSIITPDSWMEIPGARTLKDEFLNKRKLVSLFILPDEAFSVKAHFIAYLSIKKTVKELENTIDVQYLNARMEIEHSTKRTLLIEEIKNHSLIQLIKLDANLRNFNMLLKDSTKFQSLGEIIDCTVGYQLYHNSIHSPKEINEKIYHSKIRYNDEWVSEIKAKNIELFRIEFSENNFVNKNATFFRIPQKIFIESDKLLLREVVSKEGLIVARSSKEIFFPKSVISIIIKENFSENRLLTIMGYLASYVCFFDLVVNGIKGNRKFFPRLSIATLKNLSFDYELFNTDIWSLVKRLIASTNNKQDKKYFNSLYALMQAKIFRTYELSEVTAVSMMSFLKIPLVMQENIIKEFKSIIT